jgi:YbgC/YbaW family acyl-CoA thioester hydrolase
MFTIKKKINFYDCDPAGILFYARLFEINHSVYEQLIDSLNLKDDYWQSDIFVVPIIKTDGEYLKPVKTGNLISINLSVTHLKLNSFELTYEWFKSDGEIVAKSRTVHVFLDKKSWKKVHIPEEMKSGLQSHQRDYNI